MKIYAIRDRMLNYFQVPVVVHRKEDLIAAIARGINGTGDNANELSQAPDHYELWQVGEVDDQGNLLVKKEFIANCSSFIRGGVWKRRAQGDPGAETQQSALHGRPGGAQGFAGAVRSALAGKEGSARLEDQEPAQNAGRGDTSGDSRHSQR